MSRLRIAFLLPVTLTMLGASAMAATAQNVGWVALAAHVGSPATGEPLAIIHTYVQGASGLEDANTEEFSAGTHTFARVEGIYKNCIATAENVGFTITAGKWTYVDVPMTFRECQYSIGMNEIGYPGADGTGTVLYFEPGNIAGGNPTLLSCTTIGGGPAFYAWTNFHSCTGKVPYGATVRITATPGGNSCCTFDPTTFVADTNYRDNELINDFYYSFADSTKPHPQGLKLATDVGITLIGGTYGGFVSTSVFRIVNHGPNNALDLVVGATLSLSDVDSGAVARVLTMSDGYCTAAGDECNLRLLPAGDSTTLTVRMYAVPLDSASRAGDNFPPHTQTCVQAYVTHRLVDYADHSPPDPNTSNDSADCIRGGAVPVTVALGGTPPSSQTVRSGTTNVPMLEFLLTPASPQTITGVTVAASGTGNEQVDVSAVNLYLDKNGNGAVDAGDSVIATGTFATNDGIVSLAVNPGLNITAPTSLLVTYSFTVTIAERIGAGIVLAMFPLLILPSFRRRKTLLAMLIVMLTTVAITACGGDSSTGPKPGNGSVTFKSTLTGITTSTGSLSSLAVSGATITVNK